MVHLVMTKILHRLLILLIALLLNKSGFCQLTFKDFKTTLDTFSFHDSDRTIRITRKQLIESKELCANFSWAKITAYTVYPSGCNLSLREIKIKDNKITPQLGEIFGRMGPGMFLSIFPTAVNKANQSIPWGELKIMIIE
jgi:hypothetical protein